MPPGHIRCLAQAERRRGTSCEFLSIVRGLVNFQSIACAVQDNSVRFLGPAINENFNVYLYYHLFLIKESTIKGISKTDIQTIILASVNFLNLSAHKQY